MAYQSVGGKEVESGFSVQKFRLAQSLDTTTKVRERDKRQRKSLISLENFVAVVMTWQRERPPLFETDMDLELLILLLLGEIDEVAQLRQLEGLDGYDFKSEKGETIDVAFFLSSLTTALRFTGEDIDFDTAVAKANGQASGSHAIELLAEVGGNISKNSLKKDLQVLWTLWTSYLIHMKYPVNPSEVLAEYTIPKNNGNYPEELLNDNPLFVTEFGRKMDKDEQIAYFSHYRKATRIIRDFLIKYVDASVEHNGLKPDHYRPYRLFIYTFTRFPGIGIGADQALVMLENQLYKDYNIEKPTTSEIDISRLVLAN